MITLQIVTTRQSLYLYFLCAFSTGISAGITFSLGIINSHRTNPKRVVQIDILKACHDGNVSLVKQYLESGGSPSVDTMYGNTLLNIAVATGKDDIVDLLLKAKVNIHATVPVLALLPGHIPRHTVLYSAALKGKIDLCRRLLKQKISINGVFDFYNEYKPVWAAIEKGHEDLAVFLVLAGAKLNNEVIGFADNMFHKDFLKHVQLRGSEIGVCQFCFDNAPGGKIGTHCCLKCRAVGLFGIMQGTQLFEDLAKNPLSYCFSSGQNNIQQSPIPVIQTVEERS